MAKITIVCMLLIICITSNSLFAMNINKELILTVKWGSKNGDVGYKKRSRGSIDLGPSSFFVGKDGSVYILDVVNSRINKYKNNSWVSSIKLKTKYHPYDFSVANGIVYVLTNFSVESYKEDGKGLKVKMLTDKPSQILRGVWKLFKTSDGIIVTTRPDNTKGQIICMDDDFNYEKCDKWIEVFRKYFVYDVIDNKLYVDGGGDEHKFVLVTQNGTSVKSAPGFFLNLQPELFPIVSWCRAVDTDTIYVMESKKTGLTISKVFITSK